VNYYEAGTGMSLETNDVLEELENILGTEAANRFVDFYSGTNIYIPKSIVTARKYKKIRDEFKSGASYRELAQRYGYSERYVRTIIHEKGARQ